MIQLCALRPSSSLVELDNAPARPRNRRFRRWTQLLESQLRELDRAGGQSTTSILALAQTDHDVFALVGAEGAQAPVPSRRVFRVSPAF